MVESLRHRDENLQMFFIKRRHESSIVLPPVVVLGSSVIRDGSSDHISPMRARQADFTSVSAGLLLSAIFTNSYNSAVSTMTFMTTSSLWWRRREGIRSLIKV